MTDLHDFGLYWSLDFEKNIVIPEDFSKKISKIVFSQATNEYILHKEDGSEGLRIVRGQEIGSGSYGHVYKCIPLDKNEMVMKEIQCTKKTLLENIVKEAIIQIVIAKETAAIDLPKHKIEGPFTPQIYGIGYDKAENKCYILSDKMEDTMYNFVNEFPEMDTITQEEKDEMLIITLTKTMKMLSMLQHAIRFNHRDLKLDNLMYKETKYGAFDPVFIDFGFSCIKYNGLLISANDRFNHAFTETRDATQLLYNCGKYNKKAMSPRLYEVIEALLTWNHRGTICSLLDDQCGVKRWRNTYNFVNTQVGKNPNCTPLSVVKVLKAVEKGHPWIPELVEFHDKQKKQPQKKQTRKNNTKHGSDLLVRGLKSLRTVKTI